MDMYSGMAPPPLSFLKGSNLVTSLDKESPISVTESFLSKPLICTASFDEEAVPPSIHPVNLSSTSQLGISFSEIPSPDLCSYPQSVLNGNLQGFS